MTVFQFVLQRRTLLQTVVSLTFYCSHACGLNPLTITTTNSYIKGT